VLRIGDLEVVAEVADVERTLLRDEDDDLLLLRATRLLLAAQNPDGSWGRGAAEADAYRAIHPTWCALGGLRPR
jgi:hypothetical protein